jgi:hypothetical protein
MLKMTALALAPRGVFANRKFLRSMTKGFRLSKPAFDKACLRGLWRLFRFQGVEFQ